MYRLKDSYLIYQKRQINFTAQKSMPALQYKCSSILYRYQVKESGRNTSSQFIEFRREIKIYYESGSKTNSLAVATLITVSLANTICIITVLHMYYEISALLLQLEIRLMQKATQYFASRSSTVVGEIERKKKHNT